MKSNFDYSGSSFERLSEKRMEFGRKSSLWQ